MAATEESHNGQAQTLGVARGDTSMETKSHGDYNVSMALIENPEGMTYPGKS